MLKFGVIVLLTVYCPPTWASTCDECKNAYGTPTASAKCAALKTYLTCLEGSGKDDTTCPLAAADAAILETDYTGDTCKFTDTCICQKDFWKTDQSATGEADTCSAFQTYITCLKGKTALACDDSTNVTTLATAVETRMKALDTPACTITTACQCEIEAAKADISSDDKKCTAYKAQFSCLYLLTTAPCVATATIESLKSAAATSITSTTSCTVTTACQCELDAAKADISTDAKKCTAYKAQYACLYPLTTDPCVSGTHLADLKTTVATSVTSTTSCTFDDTCLCQRTYAAATKGTTAEQCTAYKNELSCLRTAQSSGCDGTTAKSAIATTAETARAELAVPDCPAPRVSARSTPQGDASTSAKYCTVLTTLKTCLSAITTTTQKGCNSTTQAALVTDTETKITAAKCGSFADHVTYTMTSLVVPVLVHLFM